MILRHDNARQRKATWRGVKVDPAGRLSLIVAAVMCVLAPIAGIVANSVMTSMWEGSWDYDPFVVSGMSITIAVIFPILAFVITARAWRYHNSGAGNVQDQLVAIDRGWLTYSFRVVGDIHTQMRNVIVARLAAGETSVRVDPQTGLIRLEGAVWRYLDLDISHPGTRVVLADGTQLAPTDGAVPPVDQLERIGAFSIPDSFEPDLYQTILANFA